MRPPPPLSSLLPWRADGLHGPDWRTVKLFTRWPGHTLHTDPLLTLNWKFSSQKSPRSTSDFVEETTDKIVNIPSVADEIHEIRQISYKAKATLNRIREFANKTKTTRKCQAASDCGSDQVCYLPTNQCKDQLTFSTDLAPQFRVGERSECALTEDCQDNEVCYQPSQVAITLHWRPLTQYLSRGVSVRWDLLRCLESVGPCRTSLVQTPGMFPRYFQSQGLVVGFIIKSV